LKDAALDVFHGVKRRTDDRDVGAEMEDARDGDGGAVEGLQNAHLAIEAVGAGQEGTLFGVIFDIICGC
jgi:hypothetical protein